MGLMASTLLGDRAGYLWNNSPHPALRAARRWSDATGTSVPCTLSTSTSGTVGIGYAGLPIGEVNVLELLERQRIGLAGEVAERRRSVLRWHDLPDGLPPEADIVVVGGEEQRIGTLPMRWALVAPFRIHLVVQVSADPEEMLQRASKRERWQFRRNLQRLGWTLEQDDSRAAFEFFYHRMHRPTMAQRHGERERSESAAVAYHEILRHGCLFFVRQGTQRVSGALCRWSADRNTLTTRLLGVLDGEAEHYDTGAFKAVYHLLLDWAARNQVPRVDFFGTEAFVSKGIFQWKRRLDPRVELPPNHFSTKRLYLRVRSDTAEVRAFLVANPLLAYGADGVLQPTYFADGERPARLDLSARCQEMAEPRVLDLDEFLDGLGPAGAGPARRSASTGPLRR
jgi:hypothetical protein